MFIRMMTFALQVSTRTRVDAAVASEPRRRAAVGIRGGPTPTSAPASAHELGYDHAAGSTAGSASGDAAAAAAGEDAARAPSVGSHVLKSMNVRARRAAATRAGLNSGGDGEDVGADTAGEAGYVPSPSTARRASRQPAQTRRGGGIVKEADHADHFLKGQRGTEVKPYQPYKA